MKALIDTSNKEKAPNSPFSVIVKTLRTLVSSSTTKVWYLDELDDITFVRILEMFLVWMVLYNYIIPLSMYVSLELQKFLASQQFQWDLQLYDRARQTCRRCWTMF